MLKLFGKAIKTYREQGLGTVWAKVKKIGPVRFFWIRAEVLGKLHRDHLPDAAEDMLQQWWVYSYFKRKYAKILRESNYSYDVEKAETPKIIWWCWFQGEENAPDLCKACLASLRLNYPDYDIRVVTQENLHQYVHMPDYIEEKFRKGQIGAAHYSDILRTLLLIEHGGAWIDSTVFSTKRAEDLLRQPFFVYQNFMKENKACVLSSWMIVSSRGGQSDPAPYARPSFPVLERLFVYGALFYLSSLLHDGRGKIPRVLAAGSRLLQRPRPCPAV